MIVDKGRGGCHIRIEHDFHIHTTLSLCAHDSSATVENYVRKAKELGLKKLGFADHMWDSAIPGASENFYKPQDFAHVAQLRQKIEKATNVDGIKLYFGCEVEYDPSREDIALTEETAKKFDFILVPNSHTHMMMPTEYYEPKKRHAQFMLNAFKNIVTSPLAKYVTAVAHPFSAVCCPYDRRLLYDMITPQEYRQVFSIAKKADIALEININDYKNCTISEIMDNPSLRMLSIAKDCGCKFTFGSDAHSAAPGEPQDFWALAYVLAELLDLQPRDLCELVR